MSLFELLAKESSLQINSDFPFLIFHFSLNIGVLPTLNQMTNWQMENDKWKIVVFVRIQSLQFNLLAAMSVALRELVDARPLFVTRDGAR